MNTGTSSRPARRILLLSAYDTESHRQWRHTLRSFFPDDHWTQLSLPPRYFAWRMRGNSLSWAFNEASLLKAKYDLLVVTSMVDLAGLRALLPQLSALPTIVYFHENQFAYPPNPNSDKAISTGQEERQGQKKQTATQVAAQMQSLFTALCADQVVFNSHYNRQTFLAGLRALLRKLPDHVPPGLADRLEDARVIPVPLSPDLPSELLSEFSPELSPTLSTVRPPGAGEGKTGIRIQERADEKTGGKSREDDVPGAVAVLEIVWNHRWEYDKGPGLLLTIVEELIRRRVRFRLHLLGRRFRQSPAEFSRILEQLNNYYRQHGITPGRQGWIEDRQAYLLQLRQADVLLSTALHDFQGLSVLEGAAMGCAPLAPDRLVYPEYLPESCRYGGALAEQEALAAADRLEDWARRKAAGAALPLADTRLFSGAALKPGYDALFSDLLNKTRKTSLP